ncbi:MAG: cation:proton antiporter [Candidatus Omnitrophica bacterium]|nr:cation:proton antiporter [Candidatus Omnitrophota bacterium]
MTDLALIQDLAVVMAVSAVIILACNALHLPVVVGYILAGILIGPHTPPFSLVHDEKNIETIANLGVIFLMFSIGLEFNLDKLKRLGLTAFFATTLEVLLMIWIGFLLGKFLGWQAMDCLFLGAVLSIASTTIIATVFIEQKLLKEKFAQICIAILIVEDLVAVFILVILSAVAASGTITLENVFYAFAKVILFITLTIFTGLLVIPRLINFIARRGNHEVLIVTMLGLCFGISILGAGMGFSLALGSFLAGAVMAESRHTELLIGKTGPLRDMFIPLFFVSIGMIFDPAVLMKIWLPILLVTAVMIVGKYSVVSFAVFLSGHSAQTAMKVALSMVQIGEFSFIIAQLGEDTGVTHTPLFSIAVSVSLISSFLTPLFIRHSDTLARVFAQFLPKPVATFGGFYTSWISQISGESKPEKPSVAVQRISPHLAPLLLYLSFVAGLFFVAYRYSPQAQEYLRHLVPDLRHSAFLYWLGVGVAIFPFWLGLIYSLDQLLWNLFFGRGKLTHELKENRSALPGRLIRIMFRAGIFIMLSLLVLSVSAPFLPHFPLLLIVGAGLTLLSFWFWALITRFQSHIENTVKLAFEKEEPGVKKLDEEKARHELEELIKREYPWEVLTETVIVPYKQTAVNQPIRDLKLPQMTGAMIMAIDREGETLANPLPSTLVMPGDILVVMGDENQIQHAVRYLSGLMAQAHRPAVSEKALALRVEISENAPSVGKTLSDLTLRAKTGASVIGLQRRDGSSFTNPAPSTQILAGDTVILFGTEAQITQAREILSGVS